MTNAERWCHSQKWMEEGQISTVVTVLDIEHWLNGDILLKKKGDAHPNTSGSSSTKRVSSTVTMIL